MEVHLEIIHARDFIVARTDGVLDKDASMETLSKIVANHPDGEDLLFDLRDVNKFVTTVSDIVEIVTFMLEHRKTFRYKIAILGEKERTKHPGFFEDFAYNRGLDVKVFRGFEQAIMWLLKINPEK